LTIIKDSAPVNLQVPQPLYQQIQKLAREAKFDSVESYILFVLQEVAGQDDGAFTPEEEEKVKTRLRNLGYL